MGGLFGKKEDGSAPVRKHYETQLGLVAEELTSDGPDLKILRFPSARCVRLATLGMSSKPMVGSHPVYAELMLSFAGEPPAWAAPVLVALARFPFHHNTCLVKGQTVPNPVPDCPYAGFLISTSVTAPKPEALFRASVGDRLVYFFSVYPLYAEEMAEAEGLLDLFGENGVDDLTRERRLNVCDPGLEAVSQALAAVTNCLNNQNAPLACQNLSEGGKAWERMGQGGRAMALYTLAGEHGAAVGPALERLAREGSQLDEAYLETARREIDGLFFPALTKQQLEHGLMVGGALREVCEGFFRIIAKSPLGKLVQQTKLPEPVLEAMRNEALQDLETWQDRLSSASLWAFLETLRDRHDVYELAYRAQLEQGGPHSQAFKELNRVQGELQGFEDLTLDVLAGPDPLRRVSATGALWAASPYSSKNRGNWVHLAQEPRVPALGTFVLSAVREGLPGVAKSLKLPT